MPKVSDDGSTVSDLAQCAGNKAVRRYRAHHVRIDYVPAPDVQAILDWWLNAKPNTCKAGVIDDLVRAGHKAISGNGQGDAPVSKS